MFERRVRIWSVISSLAAIGLAAGCIGSKTEPCGNQVCPSGFRCHAIHGCVTGEQLQACAGRGDGELCQVGGESGYHCEDEVCVLGACGDGYLDPDALEQCDDGALNSDLAPDACRTNCTPARCGDRVVDTGEVCDDGNTEVGDGCSLNCASDETCGNGLVDSASETCDDGNRRSHDGCNSVCQSESASWEVVQPGFSIGRSAHAMAFDGRRDTPVLFGGLQGAILNDTWEFLSAGVGWTRVNTATAPAARESAAMVFDAGRDRVVLFGGFGGVTGGANLDDTWEYDGVDWTPVVTANRPPRRSRHGMAYHEARAGVVLFGGADGGTQYGDTWQYDGADWQELSPGVSPTPRTDAGMAYDATRQVAVLYGGATSSGLSAETWELDAGGSWLAGPPGPEPISDHAMAWDRATGRIFVHGGRGNQPELLTRVLWYDGSGWGEVQPAGGPGGLTAHQLMDWGGGGLLLYGGLTDRSSSGETWLLNTPEPSPEWIDLSDQGRPPTRVRHMMTTDPDGGDVLLAAGFAASGGIFGDTHRFVEDRWVPVIGAGAVFVDGGEMVYDSLGGRVVAFGGVGSDRTREFDGQTWRDISPATGATPPWRFMHAMAYDAGRDRVVLYGGITADASGALIGLADHWEYDGAEWTEVAVLAAPGARGGARMVYDSQRAVTVLYGGEFEAGVGLWEYDGAAWVHVTTSATPVDRTFFGMVYDPWRGVTIVHAGQGRDAQGQPYRLNDTWEYDGVDWRRVVTTQTPPPQELLNMAFSDPRRQTVLFGGIALLDTTWQLQYRSDLPDEVCADGADNDGDGLVDCDDPDCNRSADCLAGATPPETDCRNGSDDDGDGAVDCADPNCGGLVCDASGGRCRAGQCR